MEIVESLPLSDLGKLDARRARDALSNHNLRLLNHFCLIDRPSDHPQ
jgi:hypothetical protein